MLGYQAPRLVNDVQLQAQVGATAKIYAGQLMGDYPDGAVPAGPPRRPRPAPPARPGAV